MAFSKLSFYGKRKNTDRNGECRWQERLQKITKLEAQWKANPHPKEYRPRITDPCILRKTFFRQKDAFDYARSKSEDLHVFAYESASLSKENTGQRMYMVCSYPHFWHYYSQMMKKSSCHHYEVIPEGAVCKLYFDLEFKRELNPGSDGDEMIKTFVKLMNFHLNKHYGITCQENRIVDLEATTPSKFSRHLIFLLEGAAFKDNIHAGNFVHHVCAELFEAINTGSKLPDLTKKPKTSEDTESKSSELPATRQPVLMQGPKKSEVSKSESSKLPGIQGVEQKNSSAAEQGCQTCFSSCSNKDISEKVIKEGHDDQVFGVCDKSNRTEACEKINRTDDSSNDVEEDKTEEVGFEGQTSGHVVGESCESVTGSEVSLGNVINIEKDCINNNKVDASGNGDCCKKGCEKCGSETGLKRNDPCENTTDKESFSTSPCDREEDETSSDACFGIPKSDLEKLLVKDGHGRDVLFCDLAVYTKNRNFRLFQSSKLGKNNPLRYKRKPLLYRPSVSTGRTPGEQIFSDSLIANVRFDSYLRILTWEEDSRLHFGGQGSKLYGTSARDKSAAPLEGYASSPYPEIDHYIQRLLNKDGIQGSIRRWSYFSQGELLLYEISKYRWCGNVRRHHKSNNIMFLVDLQRGVYYQKCHDPECKQINYKSEDKEIPKHLLPGYFFQEFEDDLPDVSDRELSEAMDTYLPSARSVESCKTESSDGLGNAENIGLVVKQNIPKEKVPRTVGAEAAGDDFEIDDSALIEAMDTTENL